MILFSQVADTYETALDRAIADNAESTPMQPIEGACLYMGFGYIEDLCMECTYTSYLRYVSVHPSSLTFNFITHTVIVSPTLIVNNITSFLSFIIE